MKITLTLIFCLTISTIFGQATTYSTVKVGRWILEQFPTKYLIKPFKIYTEKARITGQLTYYQELDAHGNPEGLTVTIQKDDYTSPASAYYYRKGKMVYRAEFFTRSTKAYEIINRNLDEIDEGPHVERTTLDNNKVQEFIDIYKNGEVIKTNRADTGPKVSWTSEGLLDGKFKFSDDYSNHYEGFAKNGELLFLKKITPDKIITETRIIGDTIFITNFEAGEKTTSSYFIKKRLKLTNNHSLGEDEDNYLYCYNYELDIPSVIKGEIQP